MLFLIELLTATLGLALLYTEAVKNRFLNYATSIFLIGFVPLLCVYPVIARLAVGGAYTVRRDSEEIISDPWAYVIYQALCLSILLVTYATTPKRLTDRPFVGWSEKYQSNVFEHSGILAVTALGIFMFIRSTGFSPLALINGSRFEWFNNPNYSPVLFVISTYLLALAPVGMLLALHDRRYRWAFVALVLLLAFYGLLTKERKWLIYIVSAFFAFVYIKNSYSIRVRGRAAILIAVVVITLAFWQVARGVLFSYYLTGAGDVVYESQQVALNLLTRGDFPYYYNASITAIDMNLNEDFLIPFAILRRQLLFFLPAGYSLGLKVEDISALFSDAVGGEDALRRGNMPPGFFGLFVISFGWLGSVIACLLFPLALRALDRFIHRNRGPASIVVIAHLLSSVTLLLRGDDSSATYFIISSMAIFFVLRALSQTLRLSGPMSTTGGKAR